MEKSLKIASAKKEGWRPIIEEGASELKRLEVLLNGLPFAFHPKEKDSVSAKVYNVYQEVSRMDFLSYFPGIRHKILVSLHQMEENLNHGSGSSVPRYQKELESFVKGFLLTLEGLEELSAV